MENELDHEFEQGERSPCFKFKERGARGVGSSEKKGSRKKGRGGGRRKGR